MTIDELQAYVWKRLPAWRKRLAGRAEVGNLVALAVANWDAEAISVVSPKDAADGLVSRMRHARQRAATPMTVEVGFVWIFLFELLASAIVQIILKWWFEAASHRAQMATLQNHTAP